MKKDKVSDVREKRRSLAIRFNELRTRKVTVLEWKVLLALAYNGPNNMYKIKKILGLAYPAIHKATKSLEQLKWVTIVRKEKSEKNVPMKIYGLTREGLLWILSRILRANSLVPSGRSNPESAEETTLRDLKSQRDVNLYLQACFDIKQTAKRNTILFPMVFGNWELYEEKQVARDLFDEMPEAAMSALCDYYHVYNPARRPSLEDLFTYGLYYNFIKRENVGYALDLPLKNEVRDRACELIKMHSENKDSPLRGIIHKIVRDLENELSRELKSIKSLASHCGLHSESERESRARASAR